MTTIGDRIRELRDLRNMTQQQLADGMGESSGRVIYNWEKGISRPDSDKIVKLCSVLRVSADELLGCKYGSLPYRSLRFDMKTENTPSYQNAPIVAYPRAEGFTRITEFSKMPYQQSETTVIAVEYPQAYEKGRTEPYYPILTENSMQLYAKYREELEKIPNLILCGRLADFKYYNMDQAIERALEVCKNLNI